MLGNDVVDLTTDTEKHLNQRFINRVLSFEEKTYLNHSLNENTFLWSLWACKEASYKACQKLNKQLLFSPSQFTLDNNCLSQLVNHENHKDFHGTLQHHKATLQLKISWLTADHSEHITQKIPSHQPAAVHVTAIISSKTDDWDSVQVVLRKIDDSSSYKQQSSEVRKLAQRLLLDNGISAKIHRPPLNIKDYTKPGPPILMSNNTSLPHEISLSHDNEWIAVALWPQNIQSKLSRP